MKTFNDSKRDFFKRNQTLFSSDFLSVTDYESAALAEVLSLPFPANNIDAWREWFRGQDIIGADTLSLSDLWYRWLGEQGFSGSLRERLKQFYESDLGLQNTFLKEYPGAAVAVSMEQLSQAPTDVIRVRSSIDNTERNFTAKEVKDGTLLTWVNGNGLVPIWFDQTVPTSNSCLRFIGVSNSNLQLSSTHILPTVFFYEVKVNLTAFGVASKLWQSSGDISNMSFPDANTFRIRANSVDNDITLDSPVLLNTPLTLRVERDDSNVCRVFINGVLQTNTVTVSDNIAPLYIGGLNNFIGGMWDINFNNQIVISGRTHHTFDIVNTGSSERTITNNGQVLRCLRTNTDKLGYDVIQFTADNQAEAVFNGQLIDFDGGFGLRFIGPKHYEIENLAGDVGRFFTVLCKNSPSVLGSVSNIAYRLLTRLSGTSSSGTFGYNGNNASVAAVGGSVVGALNISATINTPYRQGVCFHPNGSSHVLNNEIRTSPLTTADNTATMWRVATHTGNTRYFQGVFNSFVIYPTEISPEDMIEMLKRL